MTLALSPHADDVVLSVGSLLAEQPMRVVTVFARLPPEGLLTDYDAACGFGSSREAMIRRRREDADALSLLGIEPVWLDFLDQQYASVRPTYLYLGEVIRSMLEPGEGILAPLGLQHRDHVLVSDAALRLAESGVTVHFYSELPYRVAWPELEPARIAAIEAMGWEIHPDFLGGGATDLKEKAIACYASQEVDIHCCLVPERTWRACG